MSQNPSTTNIAPIVDAPMPTPGQTAPIQPFDPASVPGRTPQEQAAYLVHGFQGMLGQSQNPIADAYGAAKTTPYKPEGSVGGVMQQVHNRLTPLMTYLEAQKTDEAKALLKVFRGDKMGAIKIALRLLGVPSHDSFSHIMQENVTRKNHLEEFLNSNATTQEKRAAINSYRRLQIQSTQANIEQTVYDWMSQGFDKREITYLLNGRSPHTIISKNDKPFIENTGERLISDLISQLQAAQSSKDRYNIASNFRAKNNLSAEQLSSIISSFSNTNSEEYRRSIAILGEHKAAEMGRKAKSLVTEKVKILNNDLMLSPYWRGTKLGDDDSDYDNRITKTELLGNMGLDIHQYASNPADMMVPLSQEALAEIEQDPRLMEIEAKRAAEGNRAYTRKESKDRAIIKAERKLESPENIALIKSYVNMAEDFADIVNVIRSIKDSKDGKFYDNRPLATFLRYVYNTLCNGNPKIFDDLMTKCGFGEIAQETKTKSYPDTTYPEFRMNFRSGEEKLLVDKLRNDFGLMVMPYPITIPAPYECPTNKHFTIDFTITCDVLTNWERHNDSVMHPQIQTQVVFVGEYFGFSKDKIIEAESNWIKPDGKDEVGLDNKPIVPGSVVSVTQKYNLRSEWKKMAEKAVAQAVGGSAIYIDHTLEDRDIMRELDRASIIYQTKACPAGDLTCDVAYHLLIDHARQCQDTNCPVWNYVDQNTLAPVQKNSYGPAAAYILSCIYDFKIQKGLLPTTDYYSKNHNWSRTQMWEFYQTLDRLENDLQHIWAQYMQANKTKSPNTSKLLNVYRTKYEEYRNHKNTWIGDISKSVKDNIDQSIKAKEQLQKLENLFHAIRKLENSGGQMYPYSDIVDYCQRIITPLKAPKNDYEPIRISNNWYETAKQGVSYASL